MMRRLAAAMLVAAALLAGCSSASSTSSATPNNGHSGPGAVYVAPSRPATPKKVTPRVVDPTLQELNLTQATMPVREQLHAPMYVVQLFAYLQGRAQAAGVRRQGPLWYALLDPNEVVMCGQYQLTVRPFAYCNKTGALYISTFDLDEATRMMRGDQLGVLFSAIRAYGTYLVSPETGRVNYHQCLVGLLIRAVQNDGAITYGQALDLVAYQVANVRNASGHTIDGWYNLSCKPS